MFHVIIKSNVNFLWVLFVTYLYIMAVTLWAYETNYVSCADRFNYWKIGKSFTC